MESTGREIVFSNGFQILRLVNVKSMVVLSEIGLPPTELQLDFGIWYFINMVLRK